MTPSYMRLLIFGMALAFWLIARPFTGIWHDSKFYTLQALQHVNPTTFSRDLFFLYGSQDLYSVFSLFHAAAISMWGLNQGTMSLQGFGLGLWFVAAWALTRILPTKLALISLLLIVSISGRYGSHGLLSYGESFLTGRLYAEAFCLIGLSAWLMGRITWGGLAFVAACLIHPVITLPVLMIGLGLLFRPKIWFGLMVAGALLALGLGGIGVLPFTGLLQPMDSLWFSLASGRSPFVFLHTWEWDGFSRALYVVVVTATAWRTLPEGALKRLAYVTLASVLGAFVISYLGGSILKLPLIAGLQLTRVMWVALIITLILIPPLLKHNSQKKLWDQVLAWGLAVAIFIDIRTQGGYALLIMAIFWLGNRHLPDYKPARWFWILLGLIPLQTILWGLLNMRMDVELAGLMTERNIWRQYFNNSITAMAITASVYWLLTQKTISSSMMWLSRATVVGLLSLGIIFWYDMDPGLDYDSVARRAAIAPVAAQVPDNALVYWVEDPDKAWFWLGRANYLSFSQSAGSVFSRGTAIEALRRAAYVRPVSLVDSSQIWDDRSATGAQGFIAKSAVVQVCRDPLLDYVIAKSQPGDGMMYFTDPHTNYGYGLYNCRTLRAAKPTVSITNAVDTQDRVKSPL